MLRATLAVVVASFLATPAIAENWPQWRGPDGNGISRDANLPVQWSSTAGLVWTTAIPAWGCSTPVIWDNALFLTSQTEDGALLALRLDTADGRIVWTREVGRADTVREAEKRSVQKFHRLHNNASPSAVTDGKTVVFHFGNGDLAAYDFDGQQLWKRNLQDDHGPYSIWWGHANSPVLHGDSVISVCMQDTLAGTAATKQALSYLTAHDLATGKPRWMTPRETGAEAEQCDSYTTPIFHVSGGQLEMIIMGGNQLDAYDPATGKQRWFLPGLVGGRTITGAVVDGDRVFATRGQRGELLGVDVGTGRTSAASQSTDRRLPEDAVLFRHKEATPDSCTPVVVDGRVYTVSDQGIAQCLEAATGKPLWKERIPGDYKASPLAAPGRVYFLNTSGLTTVVAVGDEFKKIAENTLEDETLASPAASAGRLYIRGHDRLYCIGAK